MISKDHFAYTLHISADNILEGDCKLQFLTLGVMGKRGKVVNCLLGSTKASHDPFFSQMTNQRPIVNTPMCLVLLGGST